MILQLKMYTSKDEMVEKIICPNLCAVTLDVLVIVLLRLMVYVYFSNWEIQIIDSVYFIN